MKARIAVFCVVSGLFFTIPAAGAGHLGWWWLGGLITAAALAPVVRFGPRSFVGQFGAVALVLVVVGLVCTLSEAWVFTPSMKPQIPYLATGGTAMYLITAALVVGLARVLKLNDDGREMAVSRHSAGMTAVYVLLAGASYVVYYYIFGALTFRFFTHQYYPHAIQEVAAMGAGFYVYQWARGILMVLAVLPVIYTLRMGRWKAAVTVGILVWVVGGLAPLLAPNTLMVAAQRYIHIVEIMTQNVPLGMTAVWLLRRGERVSGSASQRVSGVAGS
jgi:hypothetical protein